MLDCYFCIILQCQRVGIYKKSFQEFVFGLFRQFSDFSVVFATKKREITIQSKCLKYKVASKFADFGKTSFKFKIAPLVHE